MARLWELTGRQHKGLTALESVRDWLDEFDKITTTEENDRHQYVLALTLRHLGNSYRLRGRLTESITELTRSLNIFSALDDGYNIAACRQNLGAAWRQLGNQARSERYFRQSLEYWERHGSVHQMVITINSLSASYLNEGRYQEAAEILHQALDKARESSQDSHASYLLAGLGDAYCGSGDGAKALSYYAQAATEASRMNNYEILIYAKLGTAKILRRAEEPAQAWQAILAALSYAEESTDGDRAAVTVEQGAYQAIFSRIELAQAQLEGALALAQNVEARQTVALAHFWLAYIHYKASRYKTSYDHMKRAINVSQELGFDAFLHEEATELTDFAGYFQTAAANDAVGTFFARGDNYAADPATKIELRGFGKGRIFRGGQEVPSVSRKARELIFFLSEQKVPISGDRIAEELWSETILAGNGLGSGFYSTITHARRALGSPETIRAADGAYSLNLRYRYDVEMFEELLNRAERTNEPEGRIDMLKSALELVTDDFLIDTDSNWTQPRREELHRKKLRTMQLLAQSYLSAGDQEPAAEMWLSIYQADMFDERALRCYVELLAEIKSKTVAINFLRRKIDDLSEEGIEAEEATFQLYERLDTSRTISKRRTGAKRLGT
jgi:tetratricopeptide (TPR) repeat protein